jgi:hypothetical protein
MTEENEEKELQINQALKELEVESTTLKILKQKLSYQLHLLQVEEQLIKNHLSIYEENPNDSLEQIELKIKKVKFFK